MGAPAGAMFVPLDPVPAFVIMVVVTVAMAVVVIVANW